MRRALSPLTLDPGSYEAYVRSILYTATKPKSEGQICYAQVRLKLIIFQAAWDIAPLSAISEDVQEHPSPRHSSIQRATRMT